MLRLLTNVTFVRAVGKGRDWLAVKVSRKVYDKMLLTDSLAWPWKWAAINCHLDPYKGRSGP